MTRAELNAYRAARSPTNRDHVCIGCGAIFRPKRTCNNKYCSFSCSLKRARARKAKEPKRCKRCPSTDVAKGKQLCRACGETRAYKHRPPALHPCSVCGQEIFGTIAKKRCWPCRRRAYRWARGGYTARKRARRYGVAYETVSPALVFERDGWQCQICRQATPIELRGSHDDKAPELDHIVPMSKGGPHSYTNTQCLCRACNRNKGSSMIYRPGV